MRSGEENGVAVELDSNGRRFAVWILDEMWGMRSRAEDGSGAPSVLWVVGNFAWAQWPIMSHGPEVWVMPLPSLHWVGPLS